MILKEPPRSVALSFPVPFRFTGKLDKLTCRLGPTQRTGDDHQVIRHARADAEPSGSRERAKPRGRAAYPA